MKEELYKKIYIKSEADLPKENGWYSVHSIGANMNDYHNSCWLGYIYKQAWLRDYDWYLQPIEPVEVEKEEIGCDNCINRELSYIDIPCIDCIRGISSIAIEDLFRRK